MNSGYISTHLVVVVYQIHVGDLWAGQFSLWNIGFISNLIKIYKKFPNHCDITHVRLTLYVADYGLSLFAYYGYRASTWDIDFILFLVKIYKESSNRLNWWYHHLVLYTTDGYSY